LILVLDGPKSSLTPGGVVRFVIEDARLPGLG